MNIQQLQNANNKQRFGRLVRYYRQMHQYTLRSLARPLGLSHAYLRQIEIGKANITQRTFDYLIRTLAITPYYDAKEEEAFYTALEKVQNDLLYLNIEPLNKTIEAQRKKHHQYNHALWGIDYILMMLMYDSTKPTIDVQALGKTYANLLKVESLLSDQQKLLLSICGANIYYHANDTYGTIKILHEALDLDLNNDYVSLVYYLLGLAYGETFKLIRSNRYLDIAIEMFDRQNNDFRSSITQIYKTLNDVKIGQKQGIEMSLYKAIAFSKQHKLELFTTVIYRNLVIFYTKHKNFNDVLETLKYWEEDTVFSCFYEIYTRLNKSEDMDALASFISACKNINDYHSQKNLIYLYGLKFFKAYINEDEAQYEALLNQFFLEAVKSESYFEIEIAYDYYNWFLRNHRRYKDALTLTEKMIKITKNAYD